MKQYPFYILRWLSISSVFMLGLYGCQPGSQNKTQKDEIKIEAKTVPVQEAAPIVCDKEGCVRFDLSTVDTHIPWIDQYFIERIKRTEPVAFSPMVSAQAQSRLIDQRRIRVSYVGQQGPIATFVLESSHLAKASGQRIQHQEYINLDLEHKKRLALHEIMLTTREAELMNVVDQQYPNKLKKGKVKQSQLRLSDNYYLDRQGLVLVYPQNELSLGAQGVLELKVPYSQLNGILQPRYLPVVPKERP